MRTAATYLLLFFLSLDSFASESENIAKVDSIYAMIEADSLEAADRFISTLEFSTFPDYEKARGYFAKGYVSVHHKMYYSQGLRDYNKALLYLEESGVHNPKMKYQLTNNKGKIFYSHNEFNRALESYTEAYELLKEYPEIPKAESRMGLVLYNLALCYFEKGDLETALRFFRDSYDLKPTDSRLIYIARCFHENGDFDAAILEYNKILINKKSENRYKAQALHNLADISLEQGDSISTISYLKKSISLRDGKNRFISLLDLGVVLQDRDKESAINYLSEAVNYIDDVRIDRERTALFEILERLTDDREYLLLYAQTYQNRYEELQEIKKEEDRYSLLIADQEYLIIKEQIYLQRIRNYAVAVGSILAIIALMVFWRYYRKKRQIIELAESLED